jgi:hypothetical protein
MSESAPDLHGFLRGGRRYAILIGIAVLAGLIAGPAAAAFSPATVTSTALVVQQVSGGCHRSTAAIADSGSLLVGAKSSPAVSLATSRGDVQVTNLTPSVLSVSATAGTASQAEAEANAVAESYIGSADSAADPVDYAADPAGQAAAQLLQPATSATGTTGLTRLLDGAGLGLLSGLLVGIAAALAGRRFSTLR